MFKANEFWIKRVCSPSALLITMGVVIVVLMGMIYYLYVEKIESEHAARSLEIRVAQLSKNLVLEQDRLTESAALNARALEAQQNDNELRIKAFALQALSCAEVKRRLKL